MGKAARRRSQSVSNIGVDRLALKARQELARASTHEGREDAEAAGEKLIDMAAEREQLEKEEAEQAAADRIDLLRVIRDQEAELPPALLKLEEAKAMADTDDKKGVALELAKQAVHAATLFPLEIASWQILIEMQRPKDKMGMFHKVESQLQAEQYLTVVGRVLMVGPTAFDGKTESGIDLSRLTATINSAEQLVGKFIIMQRYTGNDIYFAPMPAKKLRVITITEILAVTPLASLWMKM